MLSSSYRALHKPAGISVKRVKAMVSKHTEGRQFGILGEPRVNVLELNLGFDRQFPVTAQAKIEQLKSSRVASETIDQEPQTGLLCLLTVQTTLQHLTGAGCMRPHTSAYGGHGRIFS